MRGFCALLVFLSAATGSLWAIGDGPEVILRRGDANLDYVVDQADASYITNWLYSGGPEPECQNNADANDDGVVDQSDAIFIVNWLYNSGYAPPSPGPFAEDCGEDTAPYPGCIVSPCP